MHKSHQHVGGEQFIIDSNERPARLKNRSGEEQRKVMLPVALVDVSGYQVERKEFRKNVDES